MKHLITAAILAAIATAAGTATACAEGLGTDGNRNHSVIVSTVNGVSTVVVDGRQLFGDEAQPYIDAARARRHR